MGVNAKNSLADPICPTYAAGTVSNISAGQKSTNNDSAAPGQPNGYQNQTACSTVGSFNNGWENGCWSQNIQPTYSTSLLDFGHTGRQS